MNTKYLSIHPQWHFRNAGGLFLGLRIDFPVQIYNGEAFAAKYAYKLFRLTLGMVVCGINIDIKYDYVKTLPI